MARGHVLATTGEIGAVTGIEFLDHGRVLVAAEPYGAAEAARWWSSPDLRCGTAPVRVVRRGSPPSLTFASVANPHDSPHARRRARIWNARLTATAARDGLVSEP